MTPALYWQDCTVCGTRFLGKQRKIGVNVFCSKACGRVGRNASFRGAAGVTYELTDLNRETTLSWLACQKAGTHRPGLTMTSTRNWQGHDAPMPTCDVCAVPFPDLSVAFRISGTHRRQAVLHGVR